MTEKENKKILESFFSSEYHTMRSYVNKRIKASTDRDAEDIIQDVAVNLFSRADRLSPINNVAGFVFRSIRNRIIDVMRKGKPTTTSENEIGTRLMDLADGFLDADNNYSEAMKIELEAALEKLPEPYKQIIVAIDIEGYSYKEISAETGIPEGRLREQVFFSTRIETLTLRQMERQKQ